MADRKQLPPPVAGEAPAHAWPLKAFNTVVTAIVVVLGVVTVGQIAKRSLYD